MLLFMLAQLLCKLDNLEEQITRILDSTAFEVTAVVTYDQREKAKDAGFSWDATSKSWRKRVRAKAREDVDKMFEFKVLTSSQQ